MIHMARDFGFKVEAEPDDPSVVMVTCDLDTQDGVPASDPHRTST